MSTKQKIWPWLVAVGWGFISAGSIEIILIGGSNYFKSVSTDLGSPVSQVALIMTCCTMALSVCAPIAGHLFAKFDSRVVLTIMGLGVVLAYMSLSFGQNVWQWWIVGIFYGVFGSGIFIIGGPIFIGNWFVKKNGLATGIYGCVLAILSMIGQPMVATFINMFGWRQTYIYFGIIAAIMIFPFTLFVMRYKPEQMGLKPYGYEEGAEIVNTDGKEKGSGVPYKKAITSLAFVLIIISAGAECNLGGYKSNWSTIAQSDSWGYVAQYGADWARVFGATMITATTCCKLIMPIFGAVADKLGAVKMYVFGSACIIIGFAGLLWFHNIPALVYVFCFLEGFDSVLMKMGIPLAIRELFGDKDYSKIYSLIYGIINFLGAFATSLIAWAGEVQGSFDGALILGIVLTCVCLICCLLAKAAAKKLVWED